ncbi:MAG: class I SAM-dependent methyltransferase [Candidatus Kerfeldbacteria bacterium]|nr:class I SAM-dependent methyltransferase [Candidatus Kerfeldbacteria bacterium]
MNPRMTAEEYRNFYASKEYLNEYGYEDLLVTSRIREFNRALDQIEQRQRPPGRLLDVGTATGEFLVEAKKRGWTVSGTEISDSSVTIAKEKHQLDIFHGWLDQAPFSKHSFDIIHLSHVLEHVPSPQTMLKTIASFLKPTGLVVVEVPHEFDNWFVRLGRSLGRFQPSTHPSMHHVYFFTPRTLDDALRRAGFLAEVTTYSLNVPYRTLPPPLRMLGRLATEIIDRLNGGIYIQAFARPMTEQPE